MIFVLLAKGNEPWIEHCCRFAPFESEPDRNLSVDGSADAGLLKKSVPWGNSSLRGPEAGVILIGNVIRPPFGERANAVTVRSISPASRTFDWA
jgi:hypothetical protein